MSEFERFLKSEWEKARNGISPSLTSAQLIEQAQTANRNSLSFQRGTLLIMVSSFLMMCYFLLFYFGFREGLSHLGVGLMLGFFLLRIILEAYSLKKGRAKTYDQPAKATLDQEKGYLQLRLRIHGFFTFLTLCVYTLGFLLLLPEFSSYIRPFWMAALVASYFVPGILLTLVIRKNVQKELNELRVVVALNENLTEDSAEIP
jgi:Ca2+/Na+ antiporter